MGSGNWVIDNLNNALETWNNKLSEIWQLVIQSPTEFKGGGIWNVIVNIHGALQAVGLALLVLFFVIGVVKTCGSQKTGTRLKAVHTVRPGQRRCDLRTGTDDGAVQHRAGDYLHHHEQLRIRDGHSNRPAGHHCAGRSKLRIFCEHTAVGGDAHRWAIHHGAFPYHDPVGVRQIL